jgi:ribosomal protein S18 acetylase RimI-like enzyme
MLLWSTPLIAKTSTIEVGDVALYVRQLRTNDTRAIEQHFLALPKPDRQARFHGILSDDAISAYARRFDAFSMILVGAFDCTKRLVGLAEAVPTDAGRKVEVGLSVDPAFRRRGLGQRLVARALIAAFAHGAQLAECTFAPDNRPVISIVQALGGRFGPKLGYASIDRSADRIVREAA